MGAGVLVIYATMSGSTVAVARAVADGLAQNGTTVDLLPISQVTDLLSCSAVVLGAPVILGWHRDMVNFIRQNQKTLKDMPVAYFTTQLSLTKLSESDVNGVPIFLDWKLAKPPANPNKMNIVEKHGAPASCVARHWKKRPWCARSALAFSATNWITAHSSSYPGCLSSLSSGA